MRNKMKKKIRQEYDWGRGADGGEDQMISIPLTEKRRRGKLILLGVV